MATEKRLIDANALEAKMEERIAFLRNEYGDYDHYTDGYCEALDRVEDATTVDAVEVVHGRWRKTYTCSGEWPWGYECDQCKADSPRASYYCPNCGAKMDGDGNG